MNKKAIEFTFNWIFSIIVGAVVIFLAVYAANSFVKTERTFQDTETVQSLQSLLNPLQTSVESISKPSKITFPRESRIRTQCISDSALGTQQIELSSRNNIGGDWSSVSLPNKFSGYIFMNSMIQGKKVSVLVAPFSMPYKVADLVILWTGEYCLVNAPDEIISQLQIFNGSGMSFTDSKIRCPKESRQVCFVNSESDVDEGCDTRVNTYLKQVRSAGKLIYYEDSLLYGAIFADADIYECNVKRIVARAKSLAEIYADKSALLGESENCGSSMESVMKNYASLMEIKDSRDLATISVQAENVKNQQGDLLCSMWN